jgi:hypothetical protein
MDFADVIKFKDLEIGKLFQITGWAQWNYVSHEKRRTFLTSLRVRYEYYRRAKET